MIALLGPIANIATTWLEGRQEKAKAKQKLEVAKVQAQVKRVEQDGSWEEKAMDASDNRLEGGRPFRKLINIFAYTTPNRS